jgi:class 3 adenylate cyclase
VLRFAEGEELDAMFLEIEDFLASAISAPPPNRALATIMLAEGVPGRPIVVHIHAHRGILRTHTADRLLATFDAPGQAIRCALALRGESPGDGAGLRVGIHTGEIDLAGDEIEGPSLLIAQQVAQHAQDGEILVSRTVKDLVVGSAITFADRGSYPLTASGERWALFSVSA